MNLLLEYLVLSLGPGGCSHGHRIRSYKLININFFAIFNVRFQVLVGLLKLNPALHAFDFRLLGKHFKHPVPSVLAVGFHEPN